MCKLNEEQRKHSDNNRHHGNHGRIMNRQSPAGVGEELQIAAMRKITRDLQKRTAKIVKLSRAVEKFTQRLKNIEKLL